MEQTFKGNVASLKTTYVTMKKLIIAFVVLVSGVLTASASVSALKLKVDLKKQTVTVNEVVYSYSNYCLTDAYPALSKATWAVVLPQPKGMNWIDDGDYTDIYLYNGKYLVSMRNKVFEFDSNGYTVRDETKTEDYQAWQYVDAAYFCDPAFVDGRNIGYVYVEKGDDNFVIIYGNELTRK